ncbi:DUF1440 domain-containing protein [Actinopolyspora mortivallis]|nr:DUF1440 domain-containing protein [Actinopolyspora mortivallis]
MRRATGGDETVPTVLVGDTALVNPGMRDVRATVRESAPHLLREGNTDMSTTMSSQRTLLTQAAGGALAGLGGGVVFGIMMAMMGTLSMIAGLVGSDSALVGGVVHLVISAFFGVVFGLLTGSTRVGPLLGFGVAYGVVLWVVGGLILLPAGLGMPVLQLGMSTVPKLLGHLVFGVVTALCLYLFRRRGAH